MPQLARPATLSDAQRAANRRSSAAEVAAIRARARAELDRSHLAVSPSRKPKPTTVKAKRRRKKRKLTFRQEQLERREASREGLINRRVAALERLGRTEGGVADSGAVSKVEADRPTRGEVDQMFRDALVRERARNARLRGEAR